MIVFLICVFHVLFSDSSSSSDENKSGIMNCSDVLYVLSSFNAFLS